MSKIKAKEISCKIIDSIFEKGAYNESPSTLYLSQKCFDALTIVFPDFINKMYHDNFMNIKVIVDKNDKSENFFVYCETSEYETR